MLFRSCSEGSQNKQTCSDLGGEVCSADQYCKGDKISTSDLKYAQTCCLDGTCENLSSSKNQYDCTDNGGVCEIPNYGCASGYEETTDYSCQYKDLCCIQSNGETPNLNPEPTGTPKKGKAWIWIIFVLIVLALVAILFRDKLKMLIIKMKKPKGPSKPRFGGGPISGFPRPRPPPPRTARGIMPQRRIIPRQPLQQRRNPLSQNKRPRPPGELDDVLKKLKEMGK